MQLAASEMANFFKCCFPSRAEDDDVELVSAAALAESWRARYNDKLKANISRPTLQHAPAVAPPAPRLNNPYQCMRRPSEDLQDLGGGEAAHENSNPFVFSARDRAHGHALRDFHATFQHATWAVSGSYAEALWGCAGGTRGDVVSIMCPDSAHAATAAWLASQSLFTASPTDGRLLHYQGAAAHAAGVAPVAVRLRWMPDRELARLSAVEGTFGFREGPHAPVQQAAFVLLSLPALADNLALAWAKARDDGPRGAAARAELAAALVAVLGRIEQLRGRGVVGAGPLNARDNVHARHATFWAPFTAAHPAAAALFARCGLPLPPPPATRDYGRSLTSRASKPSSSSESSSSSKPPSSSRTPSSSSSSKTSSSAKPAPSTRHGNKSSSSSAAAANPTPATRHLRKGEIHPALRNQKYYRELLVPRSPPPSPQRPVHPANMLPPAAAPRSGFAALWGLAESPEAEARRRREKLAEEREAARAADRLAALAQRNRERERERQWHSRKAAERLAAEEAEKALTNFF